MCGAAIIVQDIVTYKFFLPCAECPRRDLRQDENGSGVPIPIFLQPMWLTSEN